MSNKDWTGNAASIYKTLGASNHTDKERESDDFYATEPKAIDILCAYPHISLPQGVWEPSCGSGCLSKRLEELGHHVVSTDLIDRGYGTGGVNFFEQRQMPEGCMAIITNPPYKFATEYVLHALSIMPVGGNLLIPKNHVCRRQGALSAHIWSRTSTAGTAMHRAHTLRKKRRVRPHEGWRR